MPIVSAMTLMHLYTVLSRMAVSVLTCAPDSVGAAPSRLLNQKSSPAGGPARRLVRNMGSAFVQQR